MRADQARNIPIDKYLETQGIQPVKTRLGGRELWYHSPIRNSDKTPSFKVDASKNLWYDHGLAVGGNIIDLVVDLCSCSVRDALLHLGQTGLYSNAPNSQKLRSNTVSQNSKFRDRALRGISAGEKENSVALEMIATKPLEHPALLQYLAKRKINPEIAKIYVSEIDFKRPGNSAKYFGLAYPSGEGFEVRNALFKGFVGIGKDVAFHPGNDLSLIFVFEGFIDFLSYLTLKNKTELDASVLVLNSGTMQNRALPYFQNDAVEEIRLYLDNDEMGDNCTDFFFQNVGEKKIADMRAHYQSHNDLNDWFISQAQ